MLIVLIGNGVPTAMSKYISEVFDKHPDRVKTIKRQAILLQIMIILPVTVIFYLLSPIIATTILRDPSLTPLFRLSSFIIPAFAAASFYFYYYTGLHFFRLQATLKTLRALTRIFCIIGLGYYFGVAGAVAGYIVSPLIIFLIASLYDLFKVAPNLPKTEDADFSFTRKELLKYAWPFTLFLIFYELVLTADLYFVKALLHDDYQTGLYNAAITAGRIPYFLFYALTIILLPAIAKSKTAKTDDETKSLVTQSLRLMIIILTPMLTLMYVYGAEVIQFFYGAKYAGALPPYLIFIFGGEIPDRRRRPGRPGEKLGVGPSARDRLDRGRIRRRGRRPAVVRDLQPAPRRRPGSGRGRQQQTVYHRSF
jgi:O-antigen/teichoic acid export membrane protein